MESEKTIQYIIGLKHYLKEDTKVTIEGWHKDLSNLVTRPITGQKFLNNSGTGFATGIDFSITKRLTKNYYGQIGYSYMQSKRDNHDNRGEYDFTFSQPHIFTFLTSYKPNEKWVLSGKFRYATGRPKDSYIVHSNVLDDVNKMRWSQELTRVNANRLSDFISLDLRADYRLQIQKISITAFIDIVNVLNRKTENAEIFQPLTGKTYYDGSKIFPTFGIRVEK